MKRRYYQSYVLDRLLLSMEVTSATIIRDKQSLDKFRVQLHQIILYALDIYPKEYRTDNDDGIMITRKFAYKLINAYLKALNNHTPLHSMYRPLKHTKYVYVNEMFRFYKPESVVLEPQGGIT